MIESSDDLLTTYETDTLIDQDPKLTFQVKTTLGGSFSFEMEARTIEVNGLKAETVETFQVTVCGAERIVRFEKETHQLIYFPKDLEVVDTEIIGADIDNLVGFSPTSGMTISQCPVESIELYNSEDASEAWGSSNATES